MPKTKSTKKKAARIKVRDLKPKTSKVKGGKTPSPGGPLPIPYPNRSQ